jgi:hypothetical protein
MGRKTPGIGKEIDIVTQKEYNGLHESLWGRGIEGIEG